MVISAQPTVIDIDGERLEVRGKTSQICFVFPEGAAENVPPDEYRRFDHPYRGLAATIVRMDGSEVVMNEFRGVSYRDPGVIVEGREGAACFLSEEFRYEELEGPFVAVILYAESPTTVRGVYWRSGRY